jgi:hypothetical protein
MILNLNNSDILEDDQVYVRMNNYNRVSSVMKETYQQIIDGTETTVTKPTLYKFFDVIHMNLATTYPLFSKFNNATLLDIPSAVFKNEYAQSAFDPNDTSVYILNPMEPSLKRFNIELRDKKNQLLKSTEIASFKMTICVYSKQKKF